MQVIIADRHPLYREVLRGLVQEMAPSTHCLEADDLSQALSLAEAHDSLRLALLDLSLDGMDGMHGLLRLSILRPDLPIVLVVPEDLGDTRRRALVFGAAALISKALDRDAISGAIAAILLESMRQGRGRDGDSEERLDPLTVRERMVLDALIKGRSNKQIAFELDVSDTTVKAHVSAVLRKLGVHSRTQAVIKAKNS